MALSPMMQQYINIKEKYKDTILLYRLGDFYEMFFDDAVTASRVLELTLTGRDCGLAERAPMCGVPYHAVDSYVAKLIDNGYKVAICEQTTKPGEQKGIVERKIVREITPGTKIDEEMLVDNRNNYLMSIYLEDGKVGVSWVDISTGELNHVQFDAQIQLHLNELLARVAPSEIICNGEMMNKATDLSIVKFGGVCPFTLYNESAFEYENALESVKNNMREWKSVTDRKLCVSSAGALLTYLVTTQKRTLGYLSHSELDSENDCLGIDANARKTLELVPSGGDKSRVNLYGFMNHTSTNMGARMLRKWIEKPSRDYSEINARLDAITYFCKNKAAADELVDDLKDVRDIERFATRASYGNMSPKDCRAMGDSLFALSEKVVPRAKSCENTYVRGLMKKTGDFSGLAALIRAAVSASPAAVVREGGVINDGFDKDLDGYRDIQRDSKSILKRMEETEKEQTGIKNLRIAYNRVFGYYIEVSKTQTELVPYRYIRRQTVANGERYVTEELKDLESKILNAEEYAKAREQQLFDGVVAKIKERVDDILSSAKSIAALDCVLSLWQVSCLRGYVRPEIGQDVEEIKIVEGRHPVVENLIGFDSFVPNDTLMNDKTDRIVLITGPNMAGKSVYMRQVALIIIMAHIGCYVPAKAARICPIDKIFTRVGASDDLSTGRSTFMVEMSEVSSILDNATDKSLILLDEIGRGTSTFDGLSIAWAIIDYLTATLKAKTLFSTHYHELTELEGVNDGLKNYKMTVREFKGNIIFVRKLMRGSANRSFGIEVAGLAGLPEQILTKAKEILKKLEKSDVARKEKEQSNYQLSIFSDNSNREIISIIRDLDVENLTPRKALDVLYDLREKLDNDQN